DEYEKAGLIKNDTVIIEPTSGNTGIGLALVASARGYKVIIVMPDSMSVERRKMIAGYGANLVLTKGEEGMQGAVDEAKRICEANENSFMPMQFSNPANVLAHIETTSKEILATLTPYIVVAGIGTAGTAVGISKGLKLLGCDAKVYGVEPFESPLISKGVANAHKIQGIGANFIPELFDRRVNEDVLTVKGDDAIQMARKLAREEGIMCGISSGANVVAALELARLPQNEGKSIVAIICDFGERYISTELFDD
ncbi:pyridoxal-phosphate dependent enzyme, partial [bacterium]|nr:pyridoxal-phosphate dependent enzyme [bacterium]